MGQTSTAKSAANQQRLRLTEKEWKAWAKQGDARASTASMKSGNTLLVKAGVFGVEKAEGGEDSPIIMRISSASPDRHSDTVALDGWKTDNYTPNPVVLFAHDDRDLPAGKSVKLYVEGAFLKSAWVPTPREVYEFGWTVGQLVRQGYLNAASVGFIPLAYQWNEERGDYAVDFTLQELLEWSVVPIPANPECLVEAKSMGLPVHLLGDWAAQALEGMHLKGLMTPELRSRVERTWAVATPRKLYSLPSGQKSATPDRLHLLVARELNASLADVRDMPADELAGWASLLTAERRAVEVKGPSRQKDEGAEQEQHAEAAQGEHAAGARVSCTRPGMEGKLGTVQEKKDGPCYAVLFDGDAAPTCYLLGSELPKAAESTANEEGKSAHLVDMKKATELAAGIVADQVRMWQTGRLPDDIDNI